MRAIAIRVALGVAGSAAVAAVAVLFGLDIGHVLAAYAMVVPVRWRLQLAALRSPLVSIVLVQLPVQALAVLVLVVATFASVVLRRGRRAPGD